MQHLDLEDSTRISDFWYRVEWQARGSGNVYLLYTALHRRSQHTGHIHGFLGLENALPVDNIDWTLPDGCHQIVDYFSRFITAYNPNPFSTRGSNDCLLHDLLNPTTRLHWDIHTDHMDLCNRCQKHGAIVNGSHHCLPSQCHKAGACRFHFPLAPSPSAIAYVEHPGAKERKQFAPICNDPWLNQHSKPVLLVWRANQDLQPMLDRTVAIKYISKYASKPETPSDSYLQALTTFCNRLPRHLPAKRAVQSLFAKMAADRDISAQEAVHLLLSKNLVECSRSFVNLNTDVEAPEVLQDQTDLDNEDAAFNEPFFQQYQTRPPQFDRLNAVEYCMQFNVHSGWYPILQSSNFLNTF